MFATDQNAMIGPNITPFPPPGYIPNNELTLPFHQGTYQAGGAAVTAGNPTGGAPAYSSQPQRQF